MTSSRATLWVRASPPISRLAVSSAAVRSRSSPAGSPAWMIREITSSPKAICRLSAAAAPSVAHDAGDGAQHLQGDGHVTDVALPAQLAGQALHVADAVVQGRGRKFQRQGEGQRAGNEEAGGAG